jgi:monoamine oxidase
MAATKAAEESDVVVLEAQHRVGGRVESAQHGDYWANVGTQFAEGTGPLFDQLDRLGIERGTLAGKTSVLEMQGRLVSTENPVELVLRSKMSWRARAELAVVGLRIKWSHRRTVKSLTPERSRRFRVWLDDQPASRYLRGVRSTEVDQIVRSWTRGWLGCEPEDTAATQFVYSIGTAMEKAAKVPNFSLPVGGNQALTDGLAAALGDRVRLGATVTSIDWTEDRVVVAYADDEGPARVVAARAVVAVPADQVLAIMPRLPASQRNALEKIQYGRYVLGAFFTTEVGDQWWDEHYSIGTPGQPSFQSIFNHAAPLRGQGARRDGGALVVFSGGRRADELMELSEDEIQEIFTRDLLAVLPELTDKIAEVVIRKHEKVVPFWAPGNHGSVRELRAGTGPIRFAGDYLGVPSMADAGRSGEMAAAAVLADLA